MKVQPRRGERGMILINVLVIVMLASLVLAIILAGADADAGRAQRLRDAAQARVVTRGAELSATVALRRDLVSGRQGDTLSEPWARIGDTDVAIAGGRFSFAVTDAQARFNINTLLDDDPAPREALPRIFAAAGVRADGVEGVVALLKAGGPIRDLADLARAGLNPAEVRQLAPYCTALPKSTGVNFNTAPEALLAVLMDSAASARTVAALRRGNAGLTQADLVSNQIVLPPGSAMTSDFFWARAQVTIGDTTQHLTSLLQRSFIAGKPRVVTIRRWRGRPPLQVPPLEVPALKVPAQP